MWSTRSAPGAPLLSHWPSERSAHDVPASSSNDVPISKQMDARATRNEQLRDLLSTLGYSGRSSSTSVSARKDVKDNDDHASDVAIAKIVEDDVRLAELDNPGIKPFGDCYRLKRDHRHPNMTIMNRAYEVWSLVFWHRWM